MKPQERSPKVLLLVLVVVSLFAGYPTFTHLILGWTQVLLSFWGDVLHSCIRVAPTRVYPAGGGGGARHR